MIRLDKFPDDPLPIFVSPSFGPTLMARGSFGAVRLAAARPNFIDPTDRSHPIHCVGELNGVLYVCYLVHLVTYRTVSATLE